MSGPAEMTQLIDRYGGLLIDAYGVLVSLDGALPGAVAFIAELNRRGKPYWLVSNTAARLPASAAAEMSTEVAVHRAPAATWRLDRLWP